MQGEVKDRSAASAELPETLDDIKQRDESYVVNDIKEDPPDLKTSTNFFSYCCDVYFCLKLLFDETYFENFMFNRVQ